MSIPVMKQALDAITNVLAGGDFDNPYADLKEAALALQQAIEQAEHQEPVSELLKLMAEDDLVYRLRKRAEIRRQIPDRKSVQEGKPDRIADLLEEAADVLDKLKDALEPQSSVKESFHREWVGLTPIEFNSIKDTATTIGYAITKTEAMLKEKNCG